MQAQQACPRHLASDLAPGLSPKRQTLAGDQKLLAFDLAPGLSPRRQTLAGDQKLHEQLALMMWACSGQAMAWSVAALGLEQGNLRQILVRCGWWRMMPGLGGKVTSGVRQDLPPGLVWKLLGSQVGVQPFQPSAILTGGLLYSVEQQCLVPGLHLPTAAVLGAPVAEHLTLMVSDALLTMPQECSVGCCRLGC